jgi:DNA-binding transcriptional LysR family regulator
MNIRWLVLFAMVAEEGSFSRAAGRLNVAQPWLSAQLRKLELELGVKLLERLSAGVELTPEGRELLPSAQQVAYASRQFRDLARTMGDVQSKIVRLGSHLPMLDVPDLRHLNDDFVRRYPNFTLRGDQADTPLLLEQLRAGQLDAAAAIAPISDERDDFEQLTIGPIEPFLLAPKSSEIGKGAALSGHTLTAPPDAGQPVFFDLLLSPLRQAGAVVRTAPESDRRALEHLARAHGAAVVIIDGNARDYDSDPKLTTRPLPAQAIGHVLLRLRSRPLGRAAERYWTMAAARGG